LFSAENIIQRYDGAILLVFFILFMVYIFRGMKKEKTNNFTESKTFNKLKTWLFIILGLASLILGGKMVVDNAVKIAKMLSMSEKLIGLTIISVGTSLPELATSVIASIRKKSDLAIGNVIGSNIFNIFLVLGISSVIHPQKYHISFNLDLGVYLAGTLFLFIAMFSGTKKRLDRWEALVLLIVFVVYMTWLFVGQPKG
jgi:cation:H+ antiporter